MVPVQGDPGGVHALSCSMGDHASAASAQASDFARASSVLPVASFTGLAGDNMRSYLGQMQRAATTLAEAYQAVARYLPKVADAIKAAQQDQRSMQEAQQALTAATQRLTHAEDSVNAAEAAVDAADLSLLPFGHLSVGPPPGPTPAQLAALAQARQELAQAERQVQEATRRFQAAELRFRQSEERRRSVLAAFVALCQRESEVAGMAIPQPPSPFLSPFLPLFNPLAAAQQELQAGIRGLEDLPVLLATGFLVPHVAQVVRAVRTMDVTNLNLWTASSVQHYIQAHQPKPAHHSLISVFTLERAGSSVVHAVGTGLGWLDQHTVQDLGYAWDATKAGVTGTWFALTHPAADVETLEWALNHPGQFVSKALDLPGLAQNPEKWGSELIPVVATVAVTKGIGSLEAGTASAAGDAAVRTSGLIDRAVSEAGVAKKLDYYQAANRQLDQVSSLDARASIIRRGGSGVDYFDGLQTRAAVATTCQSDGGWGRDTAVDKVAHRVVDRAPDSVAKRVLVP